MEAVHTTLLNPVQDQSSLQEEAKRIGQTFDFPYLKPQWPIPDLLDPALLRTLEGHTGLGQQLRH
ncbi:hypothetical protein PJI16_19595 [Nitrospira sp. MA-1]|nr:hypothetical protein [Nitrospira sp. MA-1]